MADFAIQRDIATIALSGASVTITAGVDYVAPASVSAAFVRIVGVAFCGGGIENTDFNGTPNRNAIKVTGTITTSLTFSRNGAQDGPIQISWEIIEYTGSIGGANEFIVRSTQDIALASTELSGDTTSISGVVTDADVVVFQTGVEQAGGAGRRATEEFLFTTDWIGGSTVARVTRGASAFGCDVTVAVVEFTGSNWNIQRVEHTYVASSTNETESIGVTLGSISKAFLHHSLRFSGTDVGADGMGQKCNISSTSQLTFFDQDIGTGAVGVAWVIENTQSSGTVMNVNQYSGTRASNVGGDPDTFTEAVTAVPSLATSSIMGEGSVTTTTSADVHRGMLTFGLTGLSVTTLIRGRDVADRDYVFEVVEWPDAGVAPAGRIMGSLAGKGGLAGMGGIAGQSGGLAG